jgi:hypothetical protein
MGRPRRPIESAGPASNRTRCNARRRRRNVTRTTFTPRERIVRLYADLAHVRFSRFLTNGLRSMSSIQPDDDEVRDGASSTTSRASPMPSPRVRLEAEILGGDLIAEPDVAAPTDTGSEAQPRGTVFIAVADLALRGYVRECLRDAGRLRVQDVDSSYEALASSAAPHVVIVDRSLQHSVVTAARDIPVIIIDDEPPSHVVAGDARRVRLAAPFSGDVLVAEVERLLS